MSGELVQFPHAGRIARAIIIMPDRQGHGDACRAVLAGFPLPDGEEIEFRGALWQVQMLIKDRRCGLPVIVHPEAKRRAKR